MPKYDFDKAENGAPVSGLDFDAGSNEQFDELLASIPEGKDLETIISAVAKSRDDEVLLRKLVGKAVTAGFAVAKGGGKVALLGLI